MIKSNSKWDILQCDGLCPHHGKLVTVALQVQIRLLNVEFSGWYVILQVQEWWWTIKRLQTLYYVSSCSTWKLHKGFSQLLSMRIGIDCIVMLKMFTQGPFSSPCLVPSNALIKIAFLIQATTADWKWQFHWSPGQHSPRWEWNRAFAICRNSLIWNFAA